MRRMILPTAILGLALIGVVYSCLVTESRDFANYKRVQAGMSIDDVEAILGPGTRVKPSEVPTVLRPVNPQDAVGSVERARKSGGTLPTARDYPTRLQPVVAGDHILQWVNARTGERILVAFKDGKVCETDFHDPNYL